MYYNLSARGRLVPGAEPVRNSVSRLLLLLAAGSAPAVSQYETARCRSVRVALPNEAAAEASSFPKCRGRKNGGRPVAERFCGRGRKTVVRRPWRRVAGRRSPLGCPPPLCAFAFFL